MLRMDALVLDGDEIVQFPHEAIKGLGIFLRLDATTEFVHSLAFFGCHVPAILEWAPNRSLLGTKQPRQRTIRMLRATTGKLYAAI